MFNLRSTRISSILAVGVLLALLLLSALAEPFMNAEAKPFLAVSPAILAQIGPSDCLGANGYGLSSSDQRLLAQLQTAAGGTATLACHNATGKLRFFGSVAAKPAPAGPGLAAQATPEAASRAFMQIYGTAFGVRDQANELTLLKNLPGNNNNTFIRFQQVYQKVPVFAGEIIIQVGQTNGIISAGGELAPDLNLDVTPQLTPAQAQATAQALVAKQYGLTPADIVLTQPDLWIYSPDLLFTQPVHDNQLVWLLSATSVNGPGNSQKPFNELVMVNAKTGTIALNYNQIAEAKDRRICNLNNTAYSYASRPDCTLASAGFARKEGDPASAITDVNLAYDYSGLTYDFYFTSFGRDSLNGAGMTLKSSVKLCLSGNACPYANAFWDGSQMYYGDGFASADDVVAHELTHGFTQFTSNLQYLNQSGAINESLSDVFGEFVDQSDGVDGAGGPVRWALGEDLSVGAIRNMKDPTLFGDPDRISSGFYYLGTQDNGGVHVNSGVNNKAAYLMTDGTVSETGGSFNNYTITGLGLSKAAQIYYETQVHLLTSGSGYADLYNYLHQACLNLLGTHGIVNADCVEVQKVVEATEMNLTPSSIRPAVAICPAATVPNNIYFDDMENAASGKWSFNAAIGSNAWSYQSAGQADTGLSNLIGLDLNTTSDNRASMTTSTGPLPANTYMYFRQNVALEDSYDGGVVEYSTNGGLDWDDAKLLITNNGYNRIIPTTEGNPLAGRQAFSGQSNGYFSTKLNLGSLTGQSVRFRFRLGTDFTVGLAGWRIDNVRIYTCSDGAAATTTSLVSSVNPSTVGQGVTFTATVAASTTPSGTVSFKEGSQTLATATLNGSGVATFTTKNLSVGTHSLTASYTATAGFSSSTSDPLNQQVNGLGGCANPNLVTLSDDLAGCGSLRVAVLTANGAGAASKVVDLTGLASGTTIQLSGSGLPVGPGVTINGLSCISGEIVTISGAGINDDGLTLNGATLHNLRVSGFNGRQIVATASGNKLDCVRANRT